MSIPVNSLACEKSSYRAYQAYAKEKGHEKTGTISASKRAALRSAEVMAKKNMPESVLDGMKSYTESLRKKRTASNNTALEKKKVRYSFKKISSKIMSCKTSNAARQVISQARREVEKLKDAKRTGKYDNDEIDAAIDHAKAMERIARKKAKHLEEEEIAKRCASSEEKSYEPAAGDEETGKDPVKEETDSLREEIGKIRERSAAGEYIESETVTNEMIEDICEVMDEMLDQIEELSDIMDDLMSNPVDMDRGDIKSLEIKHRNKEMKDMTKADSDYLKALFEHLYPSASASPAVDVAI